MRTDSPSTFQFSGCVFHAETGELWKGKFRLRLSEQNARLLRLLLEHRGAMVTREQVRLALWPDGEVLQYDQSINRAVSQLRSILRDHSPKAPPMIETIPKRGYRMVDGIAVSSQSHGGAASVAVGPALGGRAQISLEPVEEAPFAYRDEPVGEGADLPPTAALPLAVQAEESSPRPGRLGALAPQRNLLWPVLAGLALLLAGGAWGVFGWHRQAVPTAISLTIAPFESNGPDADILAESFRTNLTDALSQDPEVQVRALHTLNGSHLAVESAASGSKGLLLFGKLFVRGGQCQLQLELVHAAGDTHLASLQYGGSRNELALFADRAETDLFQKLHPGSRLLESSGVRPASLKAYSDYLQGRAFLLQWTDDALQQAVASFHNALAEDPRYARAYAGMASAYFVMSQHQATAPNATLQKAQEAADMALALDPGLAEAHAIRGQVLLIRDWNFAGAQQQLQRAVSLDPNHAIYHQWLAVLYGLRGAHAAALAEIDDAHSKDPGWPPLYMTEVFLDSNAFRFDRAETAAATLLRLKPDWALAHEQFALSLWAEKKYERAIAEWRTAAILEGASDRVLLEDEGLRALRKGGSAAYARVRLRAIATHRGVTHAEQDFMPSEWRAYAGDTEQALLELTKLVDARSPEALQIPGNPAYSHLHDDPRYRALVQRIGLPLPDASTEK